MYSVITWSRYLILATDIEISFHYKYINFVSWGFFNTPKRIFHHLFYLHKLLLSFIYLHKLYTAFFYLHKLPTEFFLPPPTSTDFFSSTNFLLSFFLHKLSTDFLTSTNFLLSVLCWVFFILSSALALFTCKRIQLEWISIRKRNWEWKWWNILLKSTWVEFDQEKWKFFKSESGGICHWIILWLSLIINIE